MSDNEVHTLAGNPAIHAGQFFFGKLFFGTFDRCLFTRKAAHLRRKPFIVHYADVSAAVPVELTD